MRRSFFLVLIACFFSAIAGAQDSQEKEKEDPRDSQLKALMGKFIKQRNEYVKARRSAKTDDDIKKAEALMPTKEQYLPDLKKLVKQNNLDGAALEASYFAIFGLDSEDAEFYKVIELNSGSKKLHPFFDLAADNGPDSIVTILETILKVSPSKENQGLACFALARRAMKTEGEQGEKEAEKYFARIEKEYADVKSKGQPLSDLIKGSLFELRNLAVGKIVPEATSTTLKGDAVKLSDYRGKVVVLDIWATWCGPCRAMIPHEREMVEKFKDKPFSLISLSADEDKKDLEEFLIKNPMPWTHWWEGDKSSILKNWNIRFFPTIYVLDAKGVIRYKNIRGKPLENAVAKLIAEVKK